MQTSRTLYISQGGLVESWLVDDQTGEIIHEYETMFTGFKRELLELIRMLVTRYVSDKCKIIVASNVQIEDDTTNEFVRMIRSENRFCQLLDVVTMHARLHACGAATARYESCYHSTIMCDNTTTKMYDGKSHMHEELCIHGDYSVDLQCVLYTEYNIIN